MKLDRAAVLLRLRAFYRRREISIGETMLEELADLCGEMIVAAMAAGAVEALATRPKPNEETR